MVERLPRHAAAAAAGALDSRAAMGPAADAFYGHPSHELDVVGVTGTNGKTTTAFLVARRARGRRAAAGAARHGRVADRRPRRAGRPAPRPRASTCRRCSGGCSTPATRAARWRCRRTRSSWAGWPVPASPRPAFTNLTQDHLDFHPTMEDYYAAKRGCSRTGPWPAAVNVGDRYGQRLAPRGGRNRAHLRRVAASRRPCARMTIEMGEGGAIALIALHAARAAAAGRAAAGRFNVENVLLRGGAGGAAGAAARGGAGGRRVGARRARPVRGGRRRPAVHGAGRLRPHARLARERAAVGRASHHVGRADRACSAAAATATAASGR